MRTKDPIFGSLENDTYAALQTIREELEARDVPCRVFHFGQELGRPECLEPICWFESNVPQLVFDGDTLVFCYVRLGVPDPKSPLFPRRDVIASFDINDPESLDKVLKEIEDWYDEYGRQKDTSQEEPQESEIC